MSSFLRGSPLPILAGMLPSLLVAGCNQDSLAKPAHREPPAQAVIQNMPSDTPRNPKTFSLPFADSAKLFAEARRRGMPLDGMLLVADTPRQKAILIGKDGIILEYPMSSSKYGNGNKADSNQTPLGWHKVAERIGGDALQGRSFTSRRPDDAVLSPAQWRSDNGKDYVLTRILWLTGLEPGLNAGSPVDSHERCIYIHGTNQEHLLGKPASHGCLRLSNRDVMELFDLSEGRELYCLIR